MLKRIGPPPEVLEKMQKMLEKYAHPRPEGPCAVEQEILEAEEKLGGPVWLKVAAARWQERKDQECLFDSSNSTEKTNT
ncbi:hypothetical protein D3C87_278940 [compost metagenome]